MNTIKTEPTKKKQVKRDYTYAVGRQKEAVARIRLYTNIKEGLVWEENAVSKKQILVNAKPIEKYFPGPLAKSQYMEPIVITDTLESFAFTIKVAGGGMNGQLDAVTKGIAKAIESLDPTKYRAVLKEKGLLSRDSRVRERRKVGTGGKARRQKQSPKR